MLAESKVKLNLPKEIDEKYNHSLSLLPPGDGTLVGNHEQLKMLEDIMYNPGNPSAVLLGEAGIGKTALVEHLEYLHKSTDDPFLVVRLSIEVLGALPENIMIARMSTLLTDMRKIRKATQEANPGKQFKLILFIDEVHKLNDYGKSIRSSAALNALKESLARGVFPIITATTSKEYFENLATDDAIDRRFNQVILEPPSLEVTKIILQKRYNYLKQTEPYVPEISENNLDELVKLTDVYVRNQVNPAKSIKMLDSAVGHEAREHLLTGKETIIDHKTFQYIFKQAGFNIDPPATAKDVKDEIKRRVKGQPLAVKLIGDAINNAFFAPRDLKKPLFVALLAGTTGVGKTETAKAVAKALFGREDAMVTINGGDYPTAEDAAEVQKVIGDDMATNKQKVILLDEFEKSHKTVQFSLMRMLDEGVVRDSHGVDRAINNTVVFATSNLGAKVFSDLGKDIKISRNSDPDKYTDKLYYTFFDKKADINRALIEGDIGAHNGIKPEILQRFQAIIPFMPLLKPIFGQIARKKIKNMKEIWAKPGAIYALKNQSIKIMTPAPQNADWWMDHLGNNSFAGLDPLSVMIVDDMINAQSEEEGARAVDGIINSRLKAKITQLISDRIDAGLSVDAKNGAFYVDTNGNASFEHGNHEHADISVTFLTTQEIEYRQLHSSF